MNFTLALITLLSTLAGCTGKADVSKTIETKPTEKQTHCFGHSLIDLPDDFFVSDGSSASFSGVGTAQTSERIDLTVVSQKISEQQFGQTVAARRAEILEHAEPDMGGLKTDRAVADNAHLFTVNVIEQSYETELLVLTGGSHVLLRTDSYHNAFAAGERRLLDFLARIQATPEGSIGDTGYCVGNIAISGKFAQESVHLRFLSQRRPGLDFTIESDTFAPDEQENLLARVDGPHSLLRTFDVNFHVLRKGTVQVASMKAQEWLSWVMLGEGKDRKKQFGFALETMRPVPSVAQPHIHLEMDTGQPDATGKPHDVTLTDADAVALWEAASRSIRARLPAAGR